MSIIRNGLVVGAVGALAAFTTAAAQTPRAHLARALQVMGGEQGVRGVRSVVADYYLTSFSLGQSETPESPPRASVAWGRVATDWQASRRARSQESRTPAGAIQRTRRVTAEDIGVLEVDGRQSPDGAGAVAAIRTGMRREPNRLLLAALDNPSALTAIPGRLWRGDPHDGLRYAAGPDTLALWFDRRSGLLTVVEVASDDPILGDRHTATWYTRWQDAGGVRLPRQVDVTVNGQLQEHAIYTRIVVDSALDAESFAIPDSIAARAQRGPLAPSPLVVRLAELGAGVWRAEGGSHHSLVVEQPGQLVVVEAPQNNARVQALLDTLRSRFPGKPVGLVVNTHHHWDHAGGLRPVIAAGIPVATHEVNAAFVRQIAAARRTLRPDELARRPRRPVLRTLTDSLAIGEGDSRVVVYAIRTVHVEGMLAAYVPAARILFAADVLTAGPTLAPVGSAEVVAAARSRALLVERFAGGHGTVVGWAEVERAAASAR